MFLRLVYLTNAPVIVHFARNQVIIFFLLALVVYVANIRTLVHFSGCQRGSCARMAYRRPNYAHCIHTSRLCLPAVEMSWYATSTDVIRTLTLVAVFRSCSFYRQSVGRTGGQFLHTYSVPMTWQASTSAKCLSDMPAVVTRLCGLRYGLAQRFPTCALPRGSAAAPGK